MRKATISRKTKETDISISVNLDEAGSVIDVPSGFVGHMLDAFARHGAIGLDIKAKGDTEVDMHHTIEDTGIVLGQAIKEALGEKRGIERYALARVPMDECLVEVCIDISNRPYFALHGEEHFHGMTGDMDLELVPEFFRALAFSAGITLHMSVICPGNSHHLAEACFKSFARALKVAVKVTGDSIPSTKGAL